MESENASSYFLRRETREYSQQKQNFSPCNENKRNLVEKVTHIDTPPTPAGTPRYHTSVAFPVSTKMRLGYGM
jgi:hypothetical protein